MRIFSKFWTLAFLVLGAVQAQTVTLYGNLTDKSSFHFYNVFVRNSGLVENYDEQDPKDLTVVLSQVADVAPEDVPVMQALMEDWIKDYCSDNFKIRVSRAENDQERIVLLCDHTLDEASCIRDQIKNLIQKTSFPSGRQYRLYESKSGVFVPIINVGTVCNISADRILQKINLRFYDDRLIYPESHFLVQVDKLGVDIK